MQRKIEQYVSKWDMLKKEDKVITGVSGGADSICLLFVLLELQKKIPFELVVVHVNHGLRGEDADGDEAYVKELCKEHGIVCEIYSENVELIAKNRKQSTEEAGRYVRREAFQKAMQTHGGTKIALAHHKNDSVETFFMKRSLEEAGFTNVIVMFANITNNGIYHAADFVAGGTGYYANGGKLIPITWACDDEDSAFRFMTEDGASLEMGVGNTYIAIVTPESPIAWEGVEAPAAVQETVASEVTAN